MAKEKLKRYLKVALKVGISGVALYAVYRQINFEEIKQLFANTNLIWLLVALLFFNGSKVVSSFRLLYYFRIIGLNLAWRFNLILLYIGMFYNLFLPGGIGGDGYKVYLLNQKYKTSVKSLVSAALLDRASGLVALVTLAFALGFFLDLSDVISGYYVWISLSMLLVYPAYYFVLRQLFKAFIPLFWLTNGYSLLVQGLQLISAYFILISLGVSEAFVSYQALFLVSSIVAVLPFTIGGVGARELTFILGHQFLGIDKNIAVAFSLWFFLITAVSSFAGAFLSTEDRTAKESVGDSVETD